MLSRLETTYLGILRVIILVVATVALVIAAIALVSATPSLIRRVTSAQGGDAPQPHLAAFIDEKKVEGTTSTVPAGGNDLAPFIDPDVKTAATNLVRYLGNRAPLSVTDWEGLIQKGDNPVLVAHSSKYYESVRKLTEELLAARGKPLTLERVGELLTWHQQRFIDAINQEDAQRTEDAARSWATLTLAGGAFLFFVLIVFIFLFVKIERSLRVVQVVRVARDDEHVKA